MIKGLIMVFLSAILFATVVYILLHLVGVLTFLASFLLALGIIAFIIIFILLFAFGVVLFFIAIYYVFEKKPTSTPGNYTLDMEQGKHKKQPSFNHDEGEESP